MFLRSKILRSPHAFSTRNGGVSRLEHTKSLNLAFGRGDGDEIVLENLNIFAREVGFEPRSVISRPQIHSDKVIKVTEDMGGEGYFIRDNTEGCDGYVTNSQKVTLGVKSADCVPILLEAEKDGKIIAVGAVHAGWRGTVAGIAAKCAERLCHEYGVEPKNIRAAIGPCIHKCCYEVGDEVFMEAEAQLGALARQYFDAVEGKVGKYMLDLAGLNEAILENCGLLPENVDTVDQCTCCHPESFFSHRYSGGVRGTMLSVIFMGNI